MRKKRAKEPSSPNIGYRHHPVMATVVDKLEQRVGTYLLVFDIYSFFYVHI